MLFRSPFFLQPSERLVISSEDVKCFFYTMKVPQCWVKYLAFNKLVPPDVLPKHLQGKRVYIASAVLPMGFLNSVSLAQHVHRNLVHWSSEAGGAAGVNTPEQELRKDRSFTVSNPAWRVYLDNYDLLERVEATELTAKRGTLAPGVLSYRLGRSMSTGRCPETRRNRWSVLCAQKCKAPLWMVSGVLPTLEK